MAELLPAAQLDPPLQGAGHFLQEDQGAAIGERIASFIASF
jgi:pimeloyl-ACP methyl ester carboxylesterase